MNCRAKTLIMYLMRLCVLIASFGLAIVVDAQTVPYRNIDDTPKLSVYPDWLYSRMTAAKGWQPSPVITDECKLSFSSSVLDPKKCEAHYGLSLWDSFLSKLYVEFDLSDVNKFQRIQFEPQPGLKIRGLLALQPNKDQKRPLVILRMGIHGNIDEFLAERFLARIIYQELGYNLLVLESLTSHGFLTINDQVTVGGVEEGLHTFYILNLFSHNQIPWSSQISDIYLMGISLSGPGVFLASYLDEHSLIGGVNKKTVKAIELFCPLVNFEQTYKEHEKPGLFSAFADLWNYRRLVALRLKDPKLNDIPLWKTFFDLTPRFMPEVMMSLNKKTAKPILKLETFKTLFPDLEFPKEFANHVNASKSLYELNRFWGFYKNGEIPMNIYLTPNDPAVINNINAELIRQGKQSGEFHNVKFTDVKGLHCALAGEYQWPFLVEMVKRGFDVK